MTVTAGGKSSGKWSKINCIDCLKRSLFISLKICFSITQFTNARHLTPRNDCVYTYSLYMCVESHVWINLCTPVVILRACMHIIAQMGLYFCVISVNIKRFTTPRSGENKCWWEGGNIKDSKWSVECPTKWSQRQKENSYTCCLWVPPHRTNMMHFYSCSCAGNKDFGM